MVRASKPKLPKIPAKIARKLMHEEQAGAQEYAKLGLDSLAADEQRHANFFKKILIKKSKEQQQLRGK